MKFSSVVFLSFMLGLLTMGLILLVLFLPQPNIENPLLFIGLSAISGFIVFAVSLILMSQLMKRKFKKIYRSIGLVYEKNGDTFGVDAQKEVEKWLLNKTSEIQKLKSTEEYRREFFGNLAHELKTPVFSVEGYILTLLEGGLEDEKINRKFLNKAAKGIDRISKIIADMDTITKIESGNLKLDIKKISVIDLINSVVSELEDLAATKNITIKFIKPDVAELFISGDKLKLEQVIFNLISNSIHYGKENGVTNISVKESGRGKVVVSVSDNGMGIEDKHLPRLFERFYRVEKSRDRNQGGSGIGLAIVKHIMEAHKQKISVESAVGKGTTFTFTLDRV